jgi:putative aldouronate transport system permease protein
LTSSGVEQDAAAISSEADGAAYAANIRYATIVVSTIPILCVYPFIQKYFIKGVMIGAVKG